ncbi:hypothetical protein Pmani_015428 [Petrolisthes manimaculis]|uniref:Uncharacterized protein n=1 Tax=Petrolisthes manimaculis TaxID=1843537 RepID=A0AAE1PTX7_9EUCA|nr:hypothetical protein Pmani_022657 [Petrolisthes manimaculis]KAK4313212.1 hypothetical protein Pmani_015428 [Petrolisthes manimaculis]
MMVVTSTLEDELTSVLDTWYNRGLRKLWSTWPASTELICGSRPDVSFFFPHLDLANYRNYMKCLSCSIESPIISLKGLFLDLTATLILAGLFSALEGCWLSTFAPSRQPTRPIWPPMETIITVTEPEKVQKRTGVEPKLASFNSRTWSEIQDVELIHHVELSIVVEADEDQELSIVLEFEFENCFSWQETARTLQDELQKQLPEKLECQGKILEKVEDLVKGILSSEFYTEKNCTNSGDDAVDGDEQ